MSTENLTKADLIEQHAERDVEFARERALDDAKALRDRMIRLVQQIEADPADASPTAGSGAIQYAADLERTLREWGTKREILRTVRLVRRATEPAPAPGNTSGG